MPTLGEFIMRARAYGYTKHAIRIPELRARILYLRRGVGDFLKLVDLPPIRESDRLTRAAVRRHALRLQSAPPQRALLLGLHQRAVRRPQSPPLPAAPRARAQPRPGAAGCC